MKTTKTTPETFTVTRRSQNLGIGWSNTPVQKRYASGASRLVIDDVTEPSVVGTLEDVAREYDRVRRMHSGGTDYAVAFFVGGVEVDRQMFVQAMEMLRTPGEKPRDRFMPRRRYMSDSETVYACGSKALRDYNRGIAESIDAQYEGRA